MSLVDLYIKDTDTNEVHRIGDNPHDMLTIRKGELHYTNLWNGGGCTLGEEPMDWYEFVDNTDDYGYNCDPRRKDRGMIRIIPFKEQQKVFKSLIEIIKVLATVDGEDADCAIGDVYRIAHVVGGKEMTKALRGGTKIRMNNITLSKWSKDDMANHIRALEEIIERESYI